MKKCHIVFICADAESHRKRQTWWLPTYGNVKFETIAWTSGIVITKLTLPGIDYIECLHKLQWNGLTQFKSFYEK